MSSIIDVQDALADFLQAGLGTDWSVNGTVPATPRGNSVHLLTAINHTEGSATFCKPTVTFTVVLMLSAQGDFSVRQQTAIRMAMKVSNLLIGSERIAGKQLPRPTGTTEFGIIDADSGLFGFRMTLSPIQIHLED